MENNMSANELLAMAKQRTNNKGRKWPWVQMKVGDAKEFSSKEYDIEEVKRAANMNGYTYNRRFKFKFENGVLTVIRVPHTQEELAEVELLALKEDLKRQAAYEEQQDREEAERQRKIRFEEEGQ